MNSSKSQDSYHSLVQAAKIGIVGRSKDKDPAAVVTEDLTATSC